MQNLIWIGAALAVIGMGAIVWSGLKVNAARRADLSDEELKARVAAMLPVNMGGLLTAVLGLMCVILGISLS